MRCVVKLINTCFGNREIVITLPEEIKGFVIAEKELFVKLKNEEIISFATLFSNDFVKDMWELTYFGIDFVEETLLNQVDNWFTEIQLYWGDV